MPNDDMTWRAIKKLICSVFGHTPERDSSPLADQFWSFTGGVSAKCTRCGKSGWAELAEQENLGILKEPPK